MNHHLFARATGKLLVAVTMVVSSLSGAFALSASAAAAASSGPIDLPAAVPTVAQLDKAGLTGFVPNG
ncbi:MAG TPA: hypothetical protein VFQ54_08880, partial [Thermomicrobiales bacterium]|nr:hypothetical protein [Thermomicrobiales bacterium]